MSINNDVNKLELIKSSLSIKYGVLVLTDFNATQINELMTSQNNVNREKGQESKL